MPVEYTRNVSRLEFVQPDGKVYEGAFSKLPGESGLSFIERDQTLQLDSDLEKLQSDSRIKESGDLPGFAFLNDKQLLDVGFTVKIVTDEHCARPKLHRLLKKPDCACVAETECEKCCGLPTGAQKRKLSAYATVNNAGRRIWRLVKSSGQKT